MVQERSGTVPPQSGSECFAAHGADIETVVLRGPAASPAMPELTPRKRALIRFALFNSLTPHHMATEAAPESEGRAVSSPVRNQGFMEDAREAEAPATKFRGPVMRPCT